MKRIISKCIVLGCIALITACHSPEKQTPEFDPATAKREIEAQNQQFSTLFVKGDSVGVANLYTEDAKFMDTGAPAVTGRPAIQSTMTGFMKAGITRVNFKTTAVFGTDSLLAEEGQLQLYVKAQKVADDKYIVLWKKEDGKWKIFRDISNSNLPQPAAK